MDDSGDVFVSDWGNDRISKFGKDGEFIFSSGSCEYGKGMLDGPSGIAMDKYGDVFVADTGNDRVQLFNKEGRHVQGFIGDAILARCARDYMHYEYRIQQIERHS